MDLQSYDCSIPEFPDKMWPTHSFKNIAYFSTFFRISSRGYGAMGVSVADLLTRRGTCENTAPVS